MAEKLKNCKLIAVDLDGTLLDDKKRIPPENIAALKEAHARGIHIVMATGRPPRAANWVYKELGVDGIVLGSGGTCIESYPSGEILYEEYIDRSAVRDIALYCREHGHFTFCMKGSDYYYESEGAHADYIKKYMHYDGFCADFVETDIVFNKGDILVKDPRETLSSAAELAELLAGRATPIIADRDIIDINPAGVDKGTGLARLAARLGVDICDTAAFGDTDNDVEMLQAAGLGVCMANGMPAALAAADLIAPPNNEGGVGRIINDYILAT